MQKTAIIFIGRSGSGKGTQAKLLDTKLRENSGLLHITTGDLFRSFMKKKDTNITAKLADDIYEEGGRHPDFLAVYLLSDIFVSDYTQDKHIILDGAARSLHEAKTLFEILKFYKVEKVKVIYLDVSFDKTKDRLMDRKRDDDNHQNILAKKTWFEKEVVPAIEYFEKEKYFDFKKIDGDREIEIIHQDIWDFVKN